MIVFKINTISVIVVFILSVRKINAPIYAENGDVGVPNIMQNNCIESVSTYFNEEENLHENAKTAIDFFQLLEDSEGSSWTEDLDSSYCTFKMLVTSEPRTFYKFSDVFDYYILFKDNLISGNIPNVFEFCSLYSEIIVNPETCPGSLASTYTFDKHDALIKVFYSFRPGELPSQPRNRSDTDSSIDLNWQYFRMIRRTFELNIGDNGMPSPRHFCYERYHL